jgi:hypothetical protein
MSALSLLRSRVSVGIDQLNPELAERYGPFIDMSKYRFLPNGYSSRRHVAGVELYYRLAIT